jgi:hypothetical protein
MNLIKFIKKLKCNFKQSRFIKFTSNIVSNKKKKNEYQERVGDFIFFAIFYKLEDIK